MLDEKDLQAIQNMICHSESNLAAQMDQFGVIREKASLESQIKKLEEDVAFLKAVVMYMATDLELLKKAR